MPRNYQKSVTLRKDVYTKAEELAKNNDKSVAAKVTELIENAYTMLLINKPEADP